MIELQHIQKTFGSFVAVQDLSVSIPSGRITGFIGPNGAGKTTTIRMMTGILSPDSGRVVVNGTDLASDPVAAKLQTALVPDSPDLFLRLSGREYAWLIADLYHVDMETRKARYASLAAEFDMAEDVDKPMSSYSHGMRQKAVIMAALLPDPEVWILDEPLTGLDPASAFLLKKKMKEHAAKGRTVFFSTHVLEVAEKLCDDILLINHGRLLYQGTLDQLCARYPDQSLEEIFLEVTGDA